MNRDGSNSVSKIQGKLQKDAKDKGVENTMQLQAEIAYNSLVQSAIENGITGSELQRVRNFAHNIVTYAVVDMYAHGVTEPSRFPGQRG